MKDIAK